MPDTLTARANLAHWTRQADNSRRTTPPHAARALQHAVADPALCAGQARHTWFIRRA